MIESIREGGLARNKAVPPFPAGGESRPRRCRLRSICAAPANSWTSGAKHPKHALAKVLTDQKRNYSGLSRRKNGQRAETRQHLVEINQKDSAALVRRRGHSFRFVGIAECRTSEVHRRTDRDKSVLCRTKSAVGFVSLMIARVSFAVTSSPRWRRTGIHLHHRIFAALLGPRIFALKRSCKSDNLGEIQTSAAGRCGARVKS